MILKVKDLFTPKGDPAIKHIVEDHNGFEIHYYPSLSYWCDKRVKIEITPPGTKIKVTFYLEQDHFTRWNIGIISFFNTAYNSLSFPKTIEKLLSTITL